MFSTQEGKMYAIWGNFFPVVCLKLVISEWVKRETRRDKKSCRTFVKRHLKEKVDVWSSLVIL